MSPRPWGECPLVPGFQSGEGEVRVRAADTEGPGGWHQDFSVCGAGGCSRPWVGWWPPDPHRTRVRTGERRGGEERHRTVWTEWGRCGKLKAQTATTWAPRTPPGLATHPGAVRGDLLPRSSIQAVSGMWNAYLSQGLARLTVLSHPLCRSDVWIPALPPPPGQP